MDAQRRAAVSSDGNEVESEIEDEIDEDYGGLYAYAHAEANAFPRGWDDHDDLEDDDPFNHGVCVTGMPHAWDDFE